MKNDTLALQGFKHRYPQKGLTLIEIMVALLLGLFLLAGILQIFISAKQSYKVQEAMSRLQENGRFAMEFIGRDVRQADYRECFADRNKSIFQMAGNNLPVTKAAIAGADGGANNSDKLYLTYADSACGAPLHTQQAQYNVSSTYTLLRTSLTSLIEGVEKMKVLYGIDTNNSGTADYFVPYSSLNVPTNTAPFPNPPPAPQPTPNLDQIVSVRVSLLLRTLEDNIASEPLSYTFPPWPVNGAMVTVTPTDRRIRRVFTSTFALRNRLK